MKRPLLTVLTILVATWLAGGHEGIAGQLQKEGELASSLVESEPAGQTGSAVRSVAENPMRDETISDKEDVQGQLDVAVSQEFNITLASNPTTGYQWELAAPLDEAVVKLVSREYKGTETMILGAGGHEIWTFRAVSRGQTIVSLKYVRPWEKGVTPDKIASYSITVH
jgi:inhibitor of cysteine peptidase